MTDDDPREQIVRLEADIEDLALAAERCRRIGLFAKAAIASGVIWIAAITVGATRLDAAAVVGVTILIIGGIVLFGSNDSTAKQIAASIRKAEMLRADLIGRIDFGPLSPIPIKRTE